MVCQREERDGDTSWAEINKVTANGLERHIAILSQLAWTHMMHHHLLDKTTVLRAATEAAHDMLRYRYSYLWMPVKVNGSVLVGGVSRRLADIMQQRRHFHARRGEHIALKDALFFSLLQQYLYP